MRDYLLDTQMIRYWYDIASPHHEPVIGRINEIRKISAEPKPKILISVITLGEIEFGHRVQIGNYATENAARMQFIREQLPAPLELSQDAAASYADLRQRVFDAYAQGDRRKPKMRPEQLLDPATALSLQIQENDLWISAQAVAHGLVLVTNDRMTPIVTASTGMSPALIVENWTQAGVNARHRK